MIVNSIENYGVKLNRLTADKIETVRVWRNTPKISKYMEYREEITPEMQKNWFAKIDNDFNHYFVLEVDGKDIGLINIKDVDYEKGEGESGFFIWDDEYLNSDYSFRATLCLYDFAFETLKLNTIVAHVLQDNKRAIRFNIAFGMKLSANQENVMNQEYRLDYTTYIEKKSKIIKYLF